MRPPQKREFDSSNLSMGMSLRSRNGLCGCLKSSVICEFESHGRHYGKFEITVISTRLLNECASKMGIRGSTPRLSAEEKGVWNGMFKLWAKN